MKPHSQRGVALVITLVMLAVVTLMAITFLAISRRERAAVSVTDEQTTSRLMADAALARAQAEVIARMQAQGSPHAYDLMVSTNFISPVGFDASFDWQQPNVTNVNYDHVRGSSAAVDGRNRLRNIGNLMLDPRPPVFVGEGTNAEFRFYLDLNRNRRFETNGFQPVYGATGLPIRTGVGTNLVWSHLVGDPEWIGMLQRPDLPHSATNRFIGRYAYLVLPAGKSLDWNFVHNNAALGARDVNLRSLGYYRNQGVGSWELNLAAFLHHLNTNVWPGYDYRGLQAPAVNASSADALAFLRYRYDGRYNNLSSARRWFFNTNGAQVADSLRRDWIDTYTDGPEFAGVKPLPADNDDPGASWAGSESPNTYSDLNELFDGNKVPANFLAGMTNGVRPSTYDRYTFYRMLGQMGMESLPAAEPKINLNYDNLPPYNATNLVGWSPGRFFLTVADRLIATARSTQLYRVNTPQNRTLVYTNTYLGEYLVRPAISVTNIQIYPFNEYSPVLHRLLQVALNLYDATTNRTAGVAGPAGPFYPTVMRPTFGTRGTNIYITGYVEVNDAAFLQNLVPLDLTRADDRARIASTPNAIVYNVPLIIGAKKGWPNLNEVAILNIAQLTRKIEIRKPSPDRPPSQTNLLYFLTLSNRFGIEAWNSYTQDLARPLRLTVRGQFSVGLTNVTGLQPPRNVATTNYQADLALNPWRSNQFLLPVGTSFIVLSNDLYNPTTGAFTSPGTNVNFIPNLGFYTPQLAVYTTNRFFYALVDSTANRLVDFACLGNMTNRLDLSQAISGQAQLGSVAGQASEPADLWSTNAVAAPATPATPTVGAQNQLDISMGLVPTTDNQWRSWSAVPAEGRDRAKSIDYLRMFYGLQPLVYTARGQRERLAAELVGKLAVQAGFSPTRKVYQETSWQVNDPLVHYTLGDLVDPLSSPNDPSRTNAIRFAIPPQSTPTNANLGRLNQRYRPWGGNPNQSSDALARDIRVRDPLITRSDDWDFPTNKLPNLGWIGRVHRGTPWQTIYLKADIADTNVTGQTSWYRWAGTLGSHPTNDWALADLFTTAPNEVAERGLLSVNQTNVAAWAAVLSGVSVLEPTDGSGAVRSLYLDQATNLLQSFPAFPTVIHRIVEGINNTRTLETNRVVGGLVGTPYFDRLGRVLATPELTYGDSAVMQSGYMGVFPRTLPHWGRDEVLERIPQQILSLLKADEPRFVVYAFGQTLKEAPSSLNFSTDVFNRMCTNYQVKSEFVTKSVIRIDGPLTNPRAVVERFNEMTAE